MRNLRTLTITTVLALALAACGGGGDDGDGASPTASAPMSADSLAIAPASYDLAVGDDQRFIAGVLTPDRQLVAFGEVAMTFAYLGADGSDDPEEVGQATATYLPVPGLESDDPQDVPTLVSASDTAGVYETTTAFDRAGVWQVTVTATVDGTERSGTGTFQVAEEHAVLTVGSPAPRTENLTVDSDVEPVAIDSRAQGDGGEIPDPELHDTTIAAAIEAGHPTLVVISTPVFCVSRFCGPITETFAEVAATYGDRAEFVHLEVWHDFEAQEVNEGAADWVLTDQGLNEPWVFLIGADGTIAGRWDNVADRAEIEQMLEGLPPLGA